MDLSGANTAENDKGRIRHFTALQELGLGALGCLGFVSWFLALFK